MKKARVCILLSLFFVAGVSRAQNVEQLRSLFAIGKWQEVLDRAPENGSREVQIMRLESLLQLGELARAQPLATALLPRLDKKQQTGILLHLMRGAELRDDTNAFFEYDKLYAALNPKNAIEVNYWRGRMQFLAGRFDLTESELRHVPLYSHYGVRAQFLLASNEIMKGEPEFALRRFEKLKSVQAFDPMDAKVIGLAASAYAKLLYERGRYSEALRAWSEIASTPADRLEMAWTALKLGDEMARAQPALAAAEYDSALRVVAQIPKDAVLKPEQGLRRRLLEAELKLRFGEQQSSIAAFEEVMRDAEKLSNEMPKTDWLSRQPEMAAIEHQVVEAERAKDELRQLIGRAERQAFSRELVQLKDNLTRLESLSAQLEQSKRETIAILQTRWKSELARFADSARVGLFSNQFRSNARIDRKINELELAKATAMKRLDLASETTQDGVPR